MASRYSGIDVVRTKWLAFVISGAAAGLAGVLLSSKLNTGSPVYGETTALVVNCGVVVGGTSFAGGIGGIPQSGLGLLVFGLLDNVMNMLGITSYYQVMLKDVQNIGLENGSQVRPDLVARDQAGKIIFVEVERDAYKGAPRIEKWRNLHTATRGDLYIICENYACLCQVRNETNQVLEGMAYSRCLTDLRSLHGNPGRGTPPKRNPRDGSLWIEKKATS